MQTRRRSLPGGLPCLIFGSGPPLVVFPGLSPDPTGTEGRMQVRMLGFLAGARTVHVIGRRRGLPPDVTMSDLADDYAAAIAHEFGGPVAIEGISTGGAIAQRFALDHPELVERMVLAATACRLADEGRAVQRLFADQLRAGHRRRANATVAPSLAATRFGGVVMASLMWTFAPALSPVQRSDLLATIAAEDQFDVTAELAHIAAPTLVVAGGRDRFYGRELIERTAAGIPRARLVLLPRRGHGQVVFDRNAHHQISRFLASGLAP